MSAASALVGAEICGKSCRLLLFQSHHPRRQIRPVAFQPTQSVGGVGPSVRSNNITPMSPADMLGTRSDLGLELTMCAPLAPFRHFGEQLPGPPLGAQTDAGGPWARRRARSSDLVRPWALPGSLGASWALLKHPDRQRPASLNDAGPPSRGKDPIEARKEKAPTRPRRRSSPGCALPGPLTLLALLGHPDRQRPAGFLPRSPSLGQRASRPPQPARSPQSKSTSRLRPMTRSADL